MLRRLLTLVEAGELEATTPSARAVLRLEGATIAVELATGVRPAERREQALSRGYERRQRPPQVHGKPRWTRSARRFATAPDSRFHFAYRPMMRFSLITSTQIRPASSFRAAMLSAESSRRHCRIATLFPQLSGAPDVRSNPAGTMHHRPGDQCPARSSKLQALQPARRKLCRFLTLRLAPP